MSRSKDFISNTSASSIREEDLSDMEVSTKEKYIDGNLKIEGNIDADSATFDKTSSIVGCFQTLDVHNLHKNITSKYLTGSIDINKFILYKRDNIEIIYVDPTNGRIDIQLGSVDNHLFELNRSITIKDVSYDSAYNVFIYVPMAQDVKLEHYNDRSLTASFGGTYVLNSCGGSVTFRFSPIKPNTWVIENQFIGNLRKV